MAQPYLPPKVAGLDSWANNFQTLIAAAPGTYGLVAADAVAITAAFNTFHAAYLLGGVLADGKTPVNPSTRTPVTVGAMRSAQSSLVQTLRTYASQIRLNPGVSNANKLALGLVLPNTTPSPVPAPVSWPILGLNSSGPLLLQVRYHDSLAGTGKAKAFGAIQVQLVGSLITPSPPPPDLAPTLATPTKSPFQLIFNSGDSGKTLTAYGRWMTRRGLTGPWSPVFNAVIP